MRQFGWGFALAALAVGVLALLLQTRKEQSAALVRAGTRGDAADPGRGPDPRIADNARRNRELQARVEQLEAELAALREAVRASFTAGSRGEDAGDVATLLDRYLLSFQDGAAGSEYFRLAVDAHAPLFVDRLTQLVADPAQPEALRIQLIGILGTERFAGDGRVVDALLGLLDAETPAEIAKPVLEALVATADAAAIPALERYAAEVPWSNLPYSIYDTIAELAGTERNAVLRRLLGRAKDDVSRTMVLDRIDRADAAGALLLFQDAWRLEKDARVTAADRLGNFRTDEFKNFVAERLAIESDPDVRAALERAKEKQNTVPDFDAMQATGPPDADPNVDHPKAWASARGNMGIQWLELSYRPPLRADRVRIFEVNSAGAVVEIQALDMQGRRRTVWRGADPTARPGVFEARIAAGGGKIAAIRLVLDTDRRAGWNEIDAVELVGPDGRAWATGAVASSSYGD